MTLVLQIALGIILAPVILNVLWVLAVIIYRALDIIIVLAFVSLLVIIIIKNPRDFMIIGLAAPSLYVSYVFFKSLEKRFGRKTEEKADAKDNKES